MDNKIIALIVIILVVIAGAVYILANPCNTNTTQNTSTNTTNITNTTNNSANIIHNQTSRNTTNETPKVNITAAQAQQIAIAASADLGFPAKPHGTPKLFKWTANKRHTWVWEVPLEFEKGSTKYSSVDVDAYTGEVIMNE